MRYNNCKKTILADLIYILFLAIIVFMLVIEYITFGNKAVSPRYEGMPFLEPIKNPLTPKIVFAEVTAYSSTLGQTDSTPHLTAHQTPVDEHTIACPRYLSFHTKIVIQGQIYECLDRMNIRYSDRFDIWRESRESALAFGHQKLEVEIRQ